MALILQKGTFEIVKDIPLKDILNRYAPGVVLRQRGARYIANCPLHEDKTPSFMIYPSNTWYCFSCSSGGDGAKLVQHITGLSPIHSARLIAQHFGIKLENISPNLVRKKSKQAAKEREIELIFKSKIDKAYDSLCFMIRTAERVLVADKPEVFEEFNHLIHRLPYWHYLADCLLSGNIDIQIKVLKIPEVSSWLD